MGYLYLATAIVAEVIATSALNASEQFTKLVPSIVVVIGYGTSFYFLSLALKTIPVSISYAIWAAMGNVLITIVGAIYFKQIPDLPAILGISLIVMGVVILNVFSNAIEP